MTQSLHSVVVKQTLEIINSSDNIVDPEIKKALTEGTGQQSTCHLK